MICRVWRMYGDILTRTRRSLVLRVVRVERVVRVFHVELVVPAIAWTTDVHIGVLIGVPNATHETREGERK